MSDKILYCGCFNKENVYKKYSSDKDAIDALKKLAIKKYAKLTDITKKMGGKWMRISWS